MATTTYCYHIPGDEATAAPCKENHRFHHIFHTAQPFQNIGFSGFLTGPLRIRRLRKPLARHGCIHQPRKHTVDPNSRATFYGQAFCQHFHSCFGWAVSNSVCFRLASQLRTYIDNIASRTLLQKWQRCLGHVKQRKYRIIPGSQKYEPGMIFVRFMPSLLPSRSRP